MMHFLDRFVYRNPKQKDSDHGGSLMQRASRLLPDKARTDAPGNNLDIKLCIFYSLIYAR